MCYQTKDLQEAMKNDGVLLETLRVDGGMVVNDWFLNHLANMLDARVDRPTCVESSALGVAYLAGLQSKVYASLDEISQMWQCDRSFEATMPKAKRDQLYDGWLNAVSKVQTQPA